MRIVLATAPTAGKRRSQVESLGLKYVAAAVREKGYDAVVLESTDLSLSASEFARRILAQTPDVVGLGVQFSHQARATAEAADALYALGNTVPILVGGQGINFAWSDILARSPAIDAAVCFEAERTMPEVMQWLKADRSGEAPAGIYLRSREGVSFTGYREPVVDLDAIPFPTRDESSGAYGQPNYMLLTSRGCQARCTFCSSGFYGNRYHGQPLWRPRSAKNVFDELSYLVVELGARAVSIVDDDFLGGNAKSGEGARRALEICELIERSGLKFKYSIELRVDEVLHAPLREMQHSGLEFVFVGVDGANAADLRLYSKGISLEEVSSAIGKIRLLGLDARWGMILFNPLSTLGSVRQSIERLRDWDIIHTSQLANRLLLYRGSPLLSYLSRNGVKLEWNSDDFEYTYQFSPEVQLLYQALESMCEQCKPIETSIAQAYFRVSTGIGVASIEPEKLSAARRRIKWLGGRFRVILSEAALSAVDAIQSGNQPPDVVQALLSLREEIDRL